MLIMHFDDENNSKASLDSLHVLSNYNFVVILYYEIICNKTSCLVEDHIPMTEILPPQLHFTIHKLYFMSYWNKDTAKYLHNRRNDR